MSAHDSHDSHDRDGRDGRDGSGSTAGLAHIEVILFLREVELFQFCSAEEVLRIAAITQERHWGPQKVIYGPNDPSDALYCVVEGRVRLDYPDDRSLLIPPRDTFGVLGILSGRLRVSQATAEVETLALGIEADDFFDLLSNEVEIVKALFRQLTLVSLPERSALK